MGKVVRVYFCMQGLVDWRLMGEKCSRGTDNMGGET